ncbi:ABC transporter substrate-binding protein [Micromonospora narathiwatensis]|uniref:Carbohydrate ABC transporter substrate-binding protein, CUT1 family (TC 3.A.1.1.-) n=1 Tax=Micromonospora narathiwatensis TaxID=299146 RepID=A0A1A8ZRK2_9ACTN|nr:sugar ABC transporter substrate-binding protein [Micromonospora narathiwatensis]SBT46512.1 carbohydrate ABC transporter substrate-binding protein, CUT1 family (TC 3.A.1.1.-) [Micromonospora narathiwatensis]
MTTRRRFLAAAAGALAATTLLAGCGKDTSGGADDGATGTITYFTFSAAPDHLKDLDAIKAEFEKQNPGIKVQVQTAAYDDYFTKLQTAIAGGTAPDTFELNYENFVTYARAGALLSLDERAKADKDYDANRLYPKALESFQFKGKLYAVPSTFSDVVLFYNKKLFDAAGVAYPTADWTWADERAAAQKLTDRSKGVYGDYQPVTFHEFYKALAQNGGSFLSEDGKKATFNDAKGLEAAQWLLGKPGTVQPTVAEIGGKADYDTALFKSGKLAMWHNGIWQISGLADTAGLDFDIVTEPGNARKANAVFMNATAVSARTKKATAAWKWARFLGSSQKAVETRLAANWELPAVNDQAAFDSYLTKTPPANRKAVFEALENIALPPVLDAQQAKMQDTVTQALEKAASGQATPQQALDEAAAAVTALIK